MNKNTINQNYTTTLTSCILDTQLGQILAVSDNHALYFLGFIDRNNLEQEIKQLSVVTKATIISGTSAPIESITSELIAYFKGTLRKFKTPLHIVGTEFQ